MTTHHPARGTTRSLSAKTVSRRVCVGTKKTAPDPVRRGCLMQDPSCYYFSAATASPTSKLPSPVAQSQPGLAMYCPLLPARMSWRALVGNAYKCGAAKPSFGLPCRIRAHAPTKIGEARLVPPHCSNAPLTTTIAPELGLASKATSGPRAPAYWPYVNPDCHDCAFSNELGLPPASSHTFSRAQVVLDARSVVPLTATTQGELAG